MNKLMNIDEFWNNLKNKDENLKQTIDVSDKVIEIVYKIIKAREELKLSQRELAKKSGMKQSALARIETFKVIPKISTLIKIANCVNVSIDAYDKNEKEIMIFYSNLMASSSLNYRISENGGMKYAYS